MLIIVTGTKLPKLPLYDLEKVRDLLAFDGPLISEYSNKKGDRFIYYWCDCDDQLNRWMVFRTTRTSIIEAMYRFISLRTLVSERNSDGFVYFVDIDEDGAEKETKLSDLREVPEIYFPKNGAMLDVEHECLLGPERYSVLIDKDWTLERLGSFPRSD